MEIATFWYVTPPPPILCAGHQIHQIYIFGWGDTGGTPTMVGKKKQEKKKRMQGWKSDQKDFVI